MVNTSDVYLVMLNKEELQIRLKFDIQRSEHHVPCLVQYCRTYSFICYTEIDKFVQCRL